LLILGDSPIFRIEKDKCPRVFIPTFKVTSIELLNAIEALLKKKKFKPTGLLEENTPDREWLANIYFYLSPEDEYKFFPAFFRQGQRTSIEVDPRYSMA
jgi:hypothetical protein